MGIFRKPCRDFAIPRLWAVLQQATGHHARLHPSPLFIQARSASKGIRAARTSRAEQDWLRRFFKRQVYGHSHFDNRTLS